MPEEDKKKKKKLSKEGFDFLRIVVLFFGGIVLVVLGIMALLFPKLMSKLLPEDMIPDDMKM